MSGSFSNYDILQSIIDTLKDGIIVANKSGDFLLFNPAARKIAGITNATATLEEWTTNYGIYLADGFTPFPPERLPLARAVKGLKTDDVTMYIQNNEVEGAYIMASGSPLVDNSGKHIGGLVVVRDITTTVQTEEALKTSEEKYRILFKNSNDAIYISSRNGQLLDANDSFLKLFGYDLSDLIGTGVSSLYKSPEQRSDLLSEIELKGEVKDYEITLKKKDGTEFQSLLSATIRIDESNQIVGYQGIIRDITVRLQAQELMREMELAEKQNKFKDQFLANMSHEIRTPMNAILGLLNLTLNTQLQPKQEKYLKSIKASSENLLEIINEILDYSKLEAGKMEINNEPFTIRKVIEETTFPLALKAQEKKLLLKTNISDKVPEVLIGDWGKLIQILNNLIGNAIKFTHYGEINLKVWVLDGDRQQCTLAFEVTDTGIGISEDKLESVFSSFTQIQEAGSRKTQGTGLGLPITKKLIDALGGSIGVKSKLHIGSSFSFTLRYKKAKKGTAPAERKSEINELKIVDAGTVRILIAEDHIINQEVAKDIILSWWPDAYIEIADNGKIALEKLLINPFDIILMDIQMPEMDGYETTKHIRKDFHGPMKNIPIIALTAHATPADAEKCLIAGMNDYVSKPFQPSDLHNKMIHHLTKNGFKLKHAIETGDENKTPIIEALKNAKLDLSYLESITGGSPEITAKMINLLLDETPIEINQMEEYVKEKNWDRLRAIAHKMKSSVNFMGLQYLKEDLLFIEKSAENNENLDILPKKVTHISKVCNIALVELKKHLEQL